MAVQRHLENGTLELFFIVDLTFSEPEQGSFLLTCLVIRNLMGS